MLCSRIWRACQRSRTHGLEDQKSPLGFCADAADACLPFDSRGHSGTILGMESHHDASLATSGACYPPSRPLGQPLESSANVRRLLAIKSMFGFTDAEIGRATKYSRPYVARLLSGDLEGSSTFYRRLEAALGRLVADRDLQVFDVQGCGVVETNIALEAAGGQRKTIPSPN